VHVRRDDVKKTALAIAGVLLFAIGCEDPSSGPNKADFDGERAALQARLEKKRAAKQKEKNLGDTPNAGAAGGSAASAFGTVDARFAYDRQGKRDPFRSFEWERPDRQTSEERGPLERFDVSQLSLVAVVWKTGNARALIKDPSGQSYVIGQGTRIGKNDGHVIQITDNLVIVKETYVDYLGQESTKDIEMRIRGSQGG
jgi:type IV pilus assembly protein PilP